MNSSFRHILIIAAFATPLSGWTQEDDDSSDSTVSETPVSSEIGADSGGSDTGTDSADSAENSSESEDIVIGEPEREVGTTPPATMTPSLESDPVGTLDMTFVQAVESEPPSRSTPPPPPAPITEVSVPEVVGEKFERTLDRSLSSIAVVDGRRVQQFHVDGLAESFRLIANVRDADFVDAGIVIRGINSEGVGG
ncbi:MAG: hypothetical protein AAGC68_12815, partial [Verrucomicrobiota bacterium]